MVRLVLAGAAGAALAYFLDPVLGRRRRHVARDRLAAAVRRSTERLERMGRAASAEVYGVRQKVAHLGAEEERPPNDAALAQKVETELFRDPHVPKGDININAEYGVVVLRGKVQRPDEIRSVEATVRRIPGVRGVQNLLHLPGTPAPSG